MRGVEIAAVTRQMAMEIPSQRRKTGTPPVELAWEVTIGNWGNKPRFVSDQGVAKVALCSLGI